MAFQPCINTGSAVARMTTWDNQTVENVYHFRLTEDLDQTLADVIAGGIISNMTEINAYVFSGNTWEDVTVTDLRTEGAPSFISTDTGTWPLAGGSGTDPLPGANAAIISWTTALRGRSYRGRTYFGGLTEGAVTSGTVTAGLLTAMDDFIDSVVTLGDLGILSRVHNKVPRDSGVLHIITGGSAKAEFATQRRRRV
jgi:hypothetical protein